MEIKRNLPKIEKSLLLGAGKISMFIPNHMLLSLYQKSGGIDMKSLLVEYKQSLSNVRKLKMKYPKHKLDRNQTQDINYGYLSNMETSLTFIIKWLSTGRQPGNIRGVERLDAYQREVLYDPSWFGQERFGQAALPVKDENSLPDPRREKRIEEALSVLTEREKEVYKMSRGEGFSFQEIGDMLGISRKTVGTLIDRSERKLQRNRGVMTCLDTM